MPAMDNQNRQWYTEHYFIDPIKEENTVAILQDQAVFHAITGGDISKQLGQEQPKVQSTVFTLDRYNADTFQGIMPDTGAAGVSTAGQLQFQALQKIDPRVQLDTSTAGVHGIVFGKGSAERSKGTIQVETPIGVITFQVMGTTTPLLLCLDDMDRLGVRFDNLNNELVQGNHIVPVVRKFGHPFMLLHRPEESMAFNHLTEPQLRQLHRRFGHPSVRRLAKILSRAGYDVDNEWIKHLTKVCEQCQLHGKAPGRFKFTLKDDHEFNYSIIVDIFYLEDGPVLHVVDSATAFNAGKFLREVSARATWEALRICWIDAYQGPPEYIVHDAGRNFASQEFRQNANTLNIEVKEVPVEAHNSVGKVERYHGPVRRAYDIIKAEFQASGDKINKELILQMAFKAINDTAGPDGLVPTLLTFGAYPRMTEMDPPAPTVVQRARAIQLAMKELRVLNAKRMISDALNMPNGPNTLSTLNLPLNSDVRVWREHEGSNGRGGWTGPHTLLSIQGQTCTVDINGPRDFRTTVVKPYYTEQTPEIVVDEEAEGPNPDNGPLPDNELANDKGQPAQPRGRGRPPGSKNKPKETPPARQGLREYVQHLFGVVDGNGTLTTSGPVQSDIPEHIEMLSHMFPSFDEQLISGLDISEVFTTAKEASDLKEALRLRAEGRITTPGAPFEQSAKTEIESLIAAGVFKFVQFDEKLHGGDDVRIFRSRLVNEVKNKMDVPYEKSRLVIQAYSDANKQEILTQSPTIQRASQRLLIAIAPTLMKWKGMKLWLRDITQAYVQSKTMLNRQILSHLPKEIKHLHPEGTIMVVIKPLYGIPEAGTHWWATYHKHHREKLSMETSTYDPCLLITKTEMSEGCFGVVGMQTDDTLILGTESFSTLEEEQLKEANFQAKPKLMLSSDTPLNFNGCMLSEQADGSLRLRQKDQAKKIKLVDPKSTDRKKEYMEQRARGAYIATICQPEASFDLSIAAQHQDPSDDDITALNKRLKWQMEHIDRGLNYIALDLATAKLYVFVDGSFANNKDLSSQIGYELVLANETTQNEQFEITGNLIHWSSTKCKRVTRSVLASEIYGMTSGADMAIAIDSTIKQITEQLGLTPIPIIVCTDSYSLYDLLVKLGNTKEKRLMIDVMALRQSYERRELQEVRWINGNDNPADALTKSSPNTALQRFIDTNRLTIRVEGWVKRGPGTME